MPVKMVKAKKSARSGSQGRSAARGRHASIRMYNVGFGDAFLVTLQENGTARRILFDCGSIEADPAAPMRNVVQRIVQDVTDADGVARIDVVVCTHRHKDHVSGFGDAAWDDVEVKEVWMPWTEHPTDPDARRIRNVQSSLAFSLANWLATRRGMALGPEELRKVARSSDIAANALMLKNDKEMKTLHNGFAGSAERRFLPEKSNATAPGAHRTFTTAVLPGVRIHVLGPSRDRDVIRDMDPPKGKSFLRMQETLATGSGLPPPPFPNEQPLVANPVLGTTMSPEDEAEIQRAGSLEDLAVAVALDKAVNGTSLMIILEIAGSYLLFPGDAQWGTWAAAMADPEWREMMSRVTFYKVGHHGSHNATPPEFVEDLMPEKSTAMISTRMRNVWPDIPRVPLLDGLTAKQVGFVRSDLMAQAVTPFHVDRGVAQLDIAL